jgi:hypothetical protein
MIKKLPYAIFVALFAHGAANATEWVQTIDADTYGGSTGTISFNDWGFSDPLNGRTAMEFDAINGFNSDQIGQIQRVITKDADFITPDAPVTVTPEWGSTDVYTNASMDAGVNFYQWGYTSKGGSTFNNMMIDKDGDYFVAQQDMTFRLYDTFDYRQVGSASQPGDAGYVADGVYPTKIAFQPYVLSDAKGWCGSAAASNPAALEAMAGQLTFDFAFDVYFQLSPGVYSYSSTEIVRNFEMRSFGEISVNVTTSGGVLQSFSASAVVNNTNPGINNTTVTGAPTDADYYNDVSFMGAGVLSDTDYCGRLTEGWVAGIKSDTSVYKFSGLIDGVADAAACTAAGGEWQAHAYSGFAYILRADGQRIIEAMDYSEYTDLSNVPTVVDGVAYNMDENGKLLAIADLHVIPVPAAVWLFGSGLLGLLAFTRRRNT